MEDLPTHAPPPEAAAEYLAGLAEEMVRTSNRSGLPFLAYLFSMASAEARSVAGGFQEAAPAMMRGTPLAAPAALGL